MKNSQQKFDPADTLLSKLDGISLKCKEIEAKLSDPKIISSPQKVKELSKEYSYLLQIVEKYDRYKKILSDLQENQQLVEQGKDDEELLKLVREEEKKLKNQKKKLENDIQALLIPRDKNDDRNTIVEIRVGTGGDEASLFAGDLFRMYSKYAESQNWKISTLSDHPTGVGGFKEIIFSVEGNDVYRKFRYESGVHRVQRIPVTESGGRIHTSAVTVAVLPEAEPVEVKINEKDIRVDTFRSSGPGGQSVNTMDSAVRIAHIPTGIVVQCQDEKSQYRNKEKAMRHLRAKLLELEEKKKASEISRSRKSQIGTGDRSEKIRTYNFPQNRVTDHRIGLTLYNLSAIMNGDLNELINALISSDYEEEVK